MSLSSFLYVTPPCNNRSLHTKSHHPQHRDHKNHAKYQHCDGRLTLSFPHHIFFPIQRGIVFVMASRQLQLTRQRRRSSSTSSFWCLNHPFLMRWNRPNSPRRTLPISECGASFSVPSPAGQWRGWRPTLLDSFHRHPITANVSPLQRPLHTMTKLLIATNVSPPPSPRWPCCYGHSVRRVHRHPRLPITVFSKEYFLPIYSNFSIPAVFLSIPVITPVICSQ